MTDVSQTLVGQWSMYAGGIATSLELDATGSYMHIAFSGGRSHWGAWDVETRNGQLWLVLRLQGAQPMVEPTPMGLQPIQWPSFESYALVGVQPNQVDFGGGTMLRAAATTAAAAYPGQAPVAFSASPGATPPQAGSTTTGSSVPTSGADTGGSNSAPPPTILKQWQTANDTNNQIQTIMTQIQLDDQKTNSNIAAMQAKESQHEFEVQESINDSWQDTFDKTNAMFQSTL